MNRMQMTENSREFKTLMNTVFVIGFVWLIWLKSLLDWLRHHQKSFIVIATVLFAELIGWWFWHLRWMLSQLFIAALLAYLQKPLWLDECATKWSLPMIARLFKAVNEVEQSMFVTINLNQANLETNADYAAPLLVIPYVTLGRNENLLAYRICLTNGILFAEKGELVFDLAFLTDNDKHSFIERMADANINQDWPEVAALIRRREQQKANEQRIAIDKKVDSIAKFDKSKSILKILLTKGENWGVSIWNLNNEGIKESSNSLLVRVILRGATTIADLRKQLPSIAKTMRVKVTVAELTDKGSANLIFKIQTNYHGKQLTVKQVEDNAANGRFELGMGDLGPVALQLPQYDFPAVLIGGLSRSGKSALTTMLILGLLSLRTGTGKRLYDDVFIGTVKDEDYKALGWAEKGMYITGQPKDTYEMLKKVDELCTSRKQMFVKSGVVNIKDYNKQHPLASMSNLLVVVDEYANLLSRAEGETVEVEGKEVKLSREIERLCVKIGQEHISRGCTLIVVTQNFAKNAVGKFYDVAGARIIGFAESNVAASLDNTGELSQAMRGQEQSRKGLFFLYSPDLVPTNGTLITKMKNGFYQVRTNYVETRDVAENFKEHYKTEELYRRDANETSLGKLPFI